MKKLVPCPRCKTQVPYSPDNAWRPFCSERCKMIDLGAWADEQYRVPAGTSEKAEPDPD